MIYNDVGQHVCLFEGKNKQHSNRYLPLQFNVYYLIVSVIGKKNCKKL